MIPYRIIIADDHKLVRQGIKSLLEKRSGITVIGEANDGIQLLSLLKKTEADMVILDISMPNMRGLEAIREIQSISKNIKILILTMHKSPEYLQHAVTAGAHGFLIKEDADTELYSAIEGVRSGESYISPTLKQELTDDLFRIFKGDYRPDHDPLTDREKEVLKLIAEGKTSQQTADSLFISVHTVSHHRANIMRKLNCKKTADLVRYAISRGYVSLTQT